MKKILLTVLLFTSTFSSFATIYYFKGAGATPINTLAANQLHNPLSWSINSDGTGASPNDFLSTADFFVVQKGSTADANRIYLTADWDVRGTVIVGNSLVSDDVKLNIGQFNLKVATLNIVDTNIGAQNRLIFNGDNSTYFNVTFGTLLT